MNSQQKAEIIEIIQKDATLSGHYADKDGQFCVIGGLAFHGGLRTKLGLQRLHTNVVNIKPLVKQIYDRFGLSVWDQDKLQDINDSTNVFDIDYIPGETWTSIEKRVIEKRRQLLIEYIESISVKE